jgi:hypothetical protein
MNYRLSKFATQPKNTYSMSKLFIILSAALALAAGTAEQAQAQTVVRGTVFKDTNLNSVFDAGEKGVKGVGVSNGIDVVLTDSRGKYELPARDPMIVFVIKPSGYKVPVDENQLPKFYRIHKPSGSPAYKYPGSAPTGELPEAVDFPLIKYDEPDEFNVIAFGDTQPYSKKDIEYLRRGAVSSLAGVEEIAFGTTLGDITGDRPDWFEPVSRVISRIGVPWYHIVGNHDHNYDSTDDALATESYEARFGPATCSFNYGKVHFIVADNIIHSINPENGRAIYVGGFREEQIRFIENDLALVPADRLVVLMVHIDLFDYTGSRIRRADRDRVFAAMSRFPNTLSLSAHTHYIKQAFFGANEGWPGVNPHHHINAGAICGDWWRGIVDQRGLPGTMMRDGSPQGYFVLRFDGNKYIYDYKVTHYDAPGQISLVVKEGQLYANFFAGNERSTLRFRVNGGVWQDMAQSVEHDPVFASIRRQWDNPDEKLPGVRPSNPVDSHHLWKAPIVIPGPDSIIEVEAGDMFGRTFVERLVVEK